MLKVRLEFYETICNDLEHVIDIFFVLQSVSPKMMKKSLPMAWHVFHVVYSTSWYYVTQDTTWILTSLKNFEGIEKKNVWLFSTTHILFGNWNIYPVHKLYNFLSCKKVHNLLSVIAFQAKETGVQMRQVCRVLYLSINSPMYLC